jgi:hypothetical protein
MFLMVVGGIGIVWQILWLLLRLFGVGMAALGGGRDGMFAMLQGALGLVFSIISIGIGVGILMGAMKMQKLQSYNFALAAAVIAMIPCISPCCWLGLPAGIWALVILMKPEVKAAFNQGGGFPVV